MDVMLTFCSRQIRISITIALLRQYDPGQDPPSAARAILKIQERVYLISGNCPECGAQHGRIPALVTTRGDYEQLFGFFDGGRTAGYLVAHVCCGWTGWISQDANRHVKANE